MATKKDRRPEWFKFWRRNRKTLDIEQLDLESRGRIFTNMMRYFDDDEAMMLEMTPLESAMFNVLKINVDDSFDEVEETSTRNRANANKRWHATACDRIPSDADGCDRMQPDATHAEYRRQNTEDRIQKTEDRGQKNTYGEYGWIKLTDEQYQKLQEDLGQAELDRCIRYIDESAQSTGNKNKWKDWNLVIRKCSRDGWGRKASQDMSWRNEVYTGAEYGEEFYNPG